MNYLDFTEVFVQVNVLAVPWNGEIWVRDGEDGPLQKCILSRNGIFKCEDGAVLYASLKQRTFWVREISKRSILYDCIDS